MRIDFQNVLDLGSGGRFLSVDQRIVSALRELLVDCAPVRLHICSFTGRGQAEYYWSTNIDVCLEQLREALSSPSIRVTAQQCFQRTGEDGKVHSLSLLTPNRPHVFIDDNPAICKEARRTNALVVEVNKRLGAVGLVEELRVLRGTIGFYMASGFTPPSCDRSRITRGSEDSAPAAGSRDLVPALSVVRARTQSRPRAQAKAQAGPDGSSTPSPQQQGVSLSAQQATLLAGASIQRAHQASEMASAAASSALQGHQAAVFAQARQRFVESEANQVVDQVRSEARSFGHHVVTETQAEALRLGKS